MKPFTQQMSLGPGRANASQPSQVKLLAHTRAKQMRPQGWLMSCVIGCYSNKLIKVLAAGGLYSILYSLISNTVDLMLIAARRDIVRRPRYLGWHFRQHAGLWFS